MADVRGRFVVFEGGEACGKTTQATRLADRLDALCTREPGGTEVGRRIRELLLDPATGEVDPRAEALLMAADRAHHVATVVEPALGAGRHVVSDRYIGSSVAYQGYGRGLDPERVADISSWATRGLEPDLVILLEVPTSMAERRRWGAPDRLEAAGDGFHQRVAEGFRTMAMADPEGWVVIDGTPDVDVVEEAVTAVVRARLELLT